MDEFDRDQDDKRPKRRKLFGKKRGPQLLDSGRSKKFGQPPGTPIHIGPRRDFKPWVSLIQYQGEKFLEFDRIEPEAISPHLDAHLINWVNVEGVHDVALVQKVAHLFDLHPLTNEDLVNTQLRPQFETFPGYYFFALKMLYRDQSNGDDVLIQEHISLVLKGNQVLTFQDAPGDVFGRIRERIRQQTGRLRSRGPDYLIYMILDSIVDGYYQVVDNLSERIDALEEELRQGPKDVHLSRMYDLRREILVLRKAIIPVRDLLNKVQVEKDVFQENTKVYLKDLSDHVTQVTEALNLSIDISRVFIDTYHSMQNQRMNNVMKTLTMISTIFLPLNFIAGIYGMNFVHMPELQSVYAYPAVLSAMGLVALGMLAFFIQKGWLFENRQRKDLWALFEAKEKKSRAQFKGHSEIRSRADSQE